MGVRIPWRGPALHVKSKLKLQSKTIQQSLTHHHSLSFIISIWLANIIIYISSTASFWRESPDFWLPRVCDLLARPGHSPRWPQAIAEDPNRSTAAKQKNRPRWTHQTHRTLLVFGTKTHHHHHSSKLSATWCRHFGLLVTISGRKSWLRQICCDQELQHAFIATERLLQLIRWSVDPSPCLALEISKMSSLKG